MRARALLMAVLGLAADASRAAEPRPALPLRFVADPACAPHEPRDRLLAALRLRLPELAIEITPDAAAAGPDASDALVWIRDEAGTCRLALATVDGPALIALGPGASDAEIDGAAVRVAWWLELRARRAEIPAGPPALRPPLEARPARRPTLLLGAQFGPSFYPTPGGAAGILRLSALLAVHRDVWLGLEGRLGTEVGVPSPLDVDVFDRSIGILARYEVTVSRRFGLGATVGLRWALPEIEADFADRVEPADPLSNLMIIAGIGASVHLAQALRLRADALAAVSVVGRRLTSDEGPAGDLGALALDFMLGVELAL